MCQVAFEAYITGGQFLRLRSPSDTRDFSGAGDLSDAEWAELAPLEVSHRSSGGRSDTPRSPCQQAEELASLPLGPSGARPTQAL